MDSKEAWLLSKIIFTLVVVLGFITIFDLTSFKTDQQGRRMLAEQRTPASLVKISELAEDHLISEAKVSTLDLNCLQVKQPLQLKSQSKQLRLVGKVCDLKSEQVAPMIVVTNVRNGYQATVFQLDETQFSTDYIFLEEGDNSIVISKVEEDNVTQTQIAELKIEHQKKFVLESESVTQ